MLRRAALAGEIRSPRTQDEAFGRRKAFVHQKRTDQCLHHITHDIFALTRAILASLLSELHKCRDAKLAADLRAGLTVDQRVVAAREIAFRLRWVALVKRPGDYHPEDAVAEEL